jgi:hypothetical protein
VQFSGGKDSSAVLYLAKEIHEERGLGPVKVIFRDEEMVSPLVVDYVMKVRDYDWVDMEWYCIPYGAEVWVLGQRQSVILWGEKRMKEGRLVREIPPWAITGYHFGLTHSKPVPEDVDYYTMQGKKGKVAFLTGVRASESMIRYRSCVQKLHENYIVTPYRGKKGMPLKFAKVIYDWQINDVFKFLSEEHGADYCEYYDLAALTGSNTRVVFRCTQLLFVALETSLLLSQTSMTVCTNASPILMRNADGGQITTLRKLSLHMLHWAGMACGKPLITSWWVQPRRRGHKVLLQSFARSMLWTLTHIRLSG